VSGTIYGLDEAYVNVIGDTMTGRLTINVGGEGNLGLDVDGNIEYTGTLKNQSPVKFQDGINLVNLGGMKGGQLPGRDVLISLEENISVTYDAIGKRRVRIPRIDFFRYAHVTPVVIKRQEEVTVHHATIYLDIENNEHLITAESKERDILQRNVGRDGALSQIGDYKITGANKISLFMHPSIEGKTLTVHYTVRRDIAQRGCVYHTIESQYNTIGLGQYIVYVEENPKGLVTEHDTAAMAKETELIIHIVPLEAYMYTADTYIIAVINENDVLSDEELEFSDNDQLACLVSAMVDARMLLILTNVDGVYDMSPENEAAKLYDEISDVESVLQNISTTKSAVGRGGMRSKLYSAHLVTSLGIALRIVNGRKEHVISNTLLKGMANGTYFPTKQERMKPVKAWMAASAACSGSIVVNVCLADILRRRKVVSLLLTGIIDIRGRFRENDIVEVCDENGSIFGKGKIRYSSDDLKVLLENDKKEVSQRHEDQAGNKNVIIHYDYFVYTQ